MADPYQTLGIGRDATDADIKKAYRKLAKELHPDRNTDNPKAAERFSDVTKAYDLLSDKTKRGQFDRGEIDGEGNPRFAGFGGGGNPFGGGGEFRPGGFAGGFAGGADSDFGDIFEGLFGGARGARGQAQAQRGGDVAYRLGVSFIDAATLAPQRITLADGKTIDLKLPAGLVDGTQMKLRGKGRAGPGGNGDGIVTIEIKPHPFFRRDGDDILLSLPITLAEAVAGGRVKVPTVDGPVMLTIPPGTGSGARLRLGGKGFVKKDGKRGDQFVDVAIDIPRDDAALAAFVENWTDERPVRAALGV